MLQLTQSLHHFLWITDRKDLIALLTFGHIELFTDELQKEYLAWLNTDEGKSYLEGGENYNKDR